MSGVQAKRFGDSYRRVRLWLACALGVAAVVGFVAVYDLAPATAQSIGGEPFSQLGADIEADATSGEFGEAVSVSADGNTVVVGAPFNDGNGMDAGQVRVFRWNGVVWSQLGVAINGESDFDLFGGAVSISADGNVIAVGAGGAGNDDGTTVGHVRIFFWDGAEWNQIGVIDGEAPFERFGSAVSISAAGDTVVAGARFNDDIGDNAGKARVFRLTGFVWTQLGADLAGEAANDRFGTAVSISAAGDTVVVGAPLNDGNGVDAGHTRVYRLTGSTWTQLGADLDGGAAGDEFGDAVSLSADGNTVVVGASDSDANGTDAGKARVFRWDGSVWSQLGVDIDGENRNDRFGSAVSISAAGDTVVVGAPLNDDIGQRAGKASVFRLTGFTWTQLGADLAGEADDDRFGTAVSISAAGDTVVIGAPLHENDSGEDAGHVRVFRELGIEVGADFNGDGFDDLVFGDEQVSSISPSGEGALQVLFGAIDGIDANGTRTVLTLGAEAEASDQFGGVWTTGDFNGDGFDDLAVGTPLAGVQTGRVDIFDGSAAGLPSVPTLTIRQGESGVPGVGEVFDRFGAALASGDFDGDGFDDLAVGAPFEALGAVANAGFVQVFPGTQFGLDRANGLSISQTLASQGVSEANDRFGTALAAADFDADGFDDLAVGVPGEELFAGADEGVVHAFRGSATGVSLTGDVFFNEGSDGVEGTPEAGDGFGSSLAASTRVQLDDAGGLRAVGYLAVGVPNEQIGPAVNAGSAYFFPGNSSGVGELINVAGGQLVDQETLGVEGTANTNDLFGRAIAAGPVTGPDNTVGIIAGVSEDLGGASNAGAFHAVPFDAVGGFDFAADALVGQDDLSVSDDLEADGFASAAGITNLINMGDFNGDGYTDLHVIANSETVTGVVSLGRSHVMYGSETLSPWDDPTQITVTHHPGDLPAVCNGLTVTVNLGAGDLPTSGDDVILGTSSADTVNGLGGDDTICGEGGDDTLVGGSGDDTIFGGDGDDTLSGAAGGDTLHGEDGVDRVNGGSGDDEIFGGDGDDDLRGQAGDDTLNGDAGVDQFFGGGGADVINTGDGGNSGTTQIVSGQSGADTITGSSEDDTLNGGAGPDDISGLEGSDDISSGRGADTVDAGDGDDVINGGPSRDILSGGEGNDTINGGTGNDDLFGDAGNDALNGQGDIDTCDGGAGAGDTATSTCEEQPLVP